MKQLKLEVIFGSQDKLSPALKILSGNSNAAARALKQTKDQVKSLESQLAKIDSFEKQKAAVQQSSLALKIYAGTCEAFEGSNCSESD